ncbi:hypothetical protein MMC12_005230 [Toensbergia leucococca]|nr:hypothetical protein [Toensbergia leucococca]
MSRTNPLTIIESSFAAKQALSGLGIPVLDRTNDDDLWLFMRRSSSPHLPPPPPPPSPGFGDEPYSNYFVDSIPLQRPGLAQQFRHPQPKKTPFPARREQTAILNYSHKHCQHRGRLSFEDEHSSRSGDDSNTGSSHAFFIQNDDEKTRVDPSSPVRSISDSETLPGDSTYSSFEPFDHFKWPPKDFILESSHHGLWGRSLSPVKHNLSKSPPVKHSITESQNRVSTNAEAPHMSHQQPVKSARPGSVSQIGASSGLQLQLLDGIHVRAQSLPGSIANRESRKPPQQLVQSVWEDSDEEEKTARSPPSMQRLSSTFRRVHRAFSCGN